MASLRELWERYFEAAGPKCDIEKTPAAIGDWLVPLSCGGVAVLERYARQQSAVVCQTVRDDADIRARIIR